MEDMVDMLGAKESFIGWWRVEIDNKNWSTRGLQLPGSISHVRDIDPYPLAMFDAAWKRSAVTLSTEQGHR
jgi:hypothetical protein